MLLEVDAKNNEEYYNKSNGGGMYVKTIKPLEIMELFQMIKNNNSVNTPQQWTCKFDSFLFNEYEFTQEELDELQADRQRQIRRETS